MKNIFKSIGWIALYIFMQFAVQLAFIIPDYANGMSDELVNEHITDIMFITTIISNAAFVIAAAVICKAKKLSVKDEWKINAVSAKSYVLPCIIALSYSMFYNMLTYDSAANSTSMIHTCAENNGVWGIPLMILALLISAPITEEVLCRGILINTLKRSFPMVAAVILSGVIFGVMHIAAGGVVLALGGIFMGLIFAVIYVRTSSLCVAVAAHAAANLPDFILYPCPQINGAAKAVIGAASLAVMAVCAVIWLKKADKSEA